MLKIFCTQRKTKAFWLNNMRFGYIVTVDSDIEINIK